MSGGRIETEAKKVGEIVTIPFDFTGKLSVGESIDSANTTISVFSGVDASPNAVLSGNASNDDPVVNQPVTGGVAGAIYLLLCRAVTSAGNRLQIATYLAIESP